MPINVPPEYQNQWNNSQTEALKDRGLLGSDVQEITITDLISEYFVTSQTYDLQLDLNFLIIFET